MTVCCCLTGFSSRIDKLEATPAIVRRELSKLPESCMDSRCSPGGCRKNCADFAAGAIVRLNSRKPSNKPPKAKGKGKR